MMISRLLLLGITLSLFAGSMTGQPAATSQKTELVEYRVAGLEKPAEILVDQWGVPHIYANTHYDAFFVQGFNAARDRLWQIDLWRRRGLGLLSEVLGEEHVEKDRAARLFLYRGDMYSEWLAYGSDAKRIAESFAAGINAFIALTRQKPELLPWEFSFLGYEPSEWDPSDAVRIRSHGLIRNVRSEVSRAQFVRKYGLDADAIRRPLSPQWTTQVPAGLELAKIPDDVLDVFNLATRGVRFQAENSTRRAALVAAGSDERGSNNWVVAPHLTQTGRPLLANDPHRGQSVPSLRYIAHLVAPRLNVIGAGEPALPGISIGHNERIAFGLTIFSIDQEDLYVYETRKGHPDEYRYQDRWEPMRIEKERIPVKGGPPRELELKFTRHGPVVYEDPRSRTAFAVRAAWLEPGMAPYFGSVEYMRATNWDEFLAAMNRWGAPSENQVYADVDGNIGWKPGGRTPIRRNWDGLLPVPGDGRYEWDGFYDMDQLPVEFNPPRGWSATANEMNLPEDYPYKDIKLGFEWSDPSRKQRISEVLSATRKSTVQNMLDLQNDHFSIQARRAISSIRSMQFSNPRAQQALQILGSWDFYFRNDSSPGALFHLWFFREVIGRELASIAVPSAPEDFALDEQVVLSILENPSTLPNSKTPKEDVRQAVERSLARAMEGLSDRLGENPAEWRYGEFNKMGLKHALSAIVPEERRAAIDIAEEEKCSVAGTVGTTNASWRQVLDVGNWDNSIALSNPGQSGDPKSPFYRNLWDLWVECGSFPLLYTRHKIEEATVLTIKLSPSP